MPGNTTEKDRNKTNKRICDTKSVIRERERERERSSKKINVQMNEVEEIGKIMKTSNRRESIRNVLRRNAMKSLEINTIS